MYAFSPGGLPKVATVSTDSLRTGGRWTLGVHYAICAFNPSNVVAKGGLDSLLIFAAVLRIVARTRSTHGEADSVPIQYRQLSAENNY